MRDPVVILHAAADELPKGSLGEESLRSLARRCAGGASLASVCAWLRIISDNEAYTADERAAAQLARDEIVR